MRNNKKEEEHLQNINTREYWDRVYSLEVSNAEWRRYLVGYGKIRTYLGIRANTKETILDVGCGYGLLLNQLSSLDCELTGWDISKIAITEIINKGYQGRVLDFAKYSPSEADAFDHVIATEFLEHFEDPKPILAKMLKIAKKTVVFVIPNNCLSNSECKEHMCAFDFQYVRRMIHEITFTQGYVEEFMEEFVYIDKKGTVTLVKVPCLLAIIDKDYQ